MRGYPTGMTHGRGQAMIRIAEFKIPARDAKQALAAAKANARNAGWYVEDVITRPYPVGKNGTLTVFRCELMISREGGKK